MVRSRKPKRKASRKKSRSPKRSSKRCPPGCVKRKVARKTSRKRRSVKRKVSRKRKSAKRKTSRKRKSAKRKVSRKRKSAKRKVSRKRKSAKRKVSRKRKSAKRKVSRKRKSVKHKFRLSYKKDSYRLPSKKSNNRCDRIAKDYIHKLYKISNTLHDKQKQLGCGVKKRNDEGKYISRYPHSTSLNLQNMLTLMDHLHPIRKKGQRSSRRSYRPPSRRSYRPPSRRSHRPSSPWGLSHASTRILSRPSSGGSSRPTSRRLSEDFEDPAMLELMESLSTADPVARTPSRIARNDTGIDEILSTLSDRSQRQELSASNLAEHDRMQRERLASAGIVSSPSSTISRPRTSPAALRALEDAGTVIMERAGTI